MNFHISNSQRHVEELLELVELPYLTQTETPFGAGGTGGTSIFRTQRHPVELVELGELHISHRQRLPVALV